MSITNDIESKIDIVELVREYVPLKKAGVNYKGLSPFKTEKTPSFVVSPAKQIAYCFATNQWWGPLKFLMLIEKLEFKEALHILAKRAWVELETDAFKEKWQSTGQLYEIYEIATWHYHAELMSEKNKDKVAYLTDRWLTMDTIRDWQLGYSENPRDLFFKLREKWYEDKVILSDSGIFVNQHKDRFYERIIFPISNYRWGVVAFSGRTLSKEKNISKYVNSPETSIFHKSNILFGMHRAKQPITQKNQVIIVEWQMDVISLHQAGYDNVVGISGTALTDQQIKQITRLTDQVCLCLDNDDAGKKATFSSIENLQNQDVDISVVQLGEFKDPDEALQSKNWFDHYLEHAVSHIQFMIDEAKSRYNIDTNQGKKKLVEELLPYLGWVKSSMEVDLYLQELAKTTGISLQILWSQYNGAKENLRFRRKTEREADKEQTPKSHSPADHLMVLILGTNDVDFFREVFLFYEDREYLTAYSPLWSYLSTGSVDDEDRMKYELIYEEQYSDMTPEKIREHYRKAIEWLNTWSFRELQKVYTHNLATKEDLTRLQKLNEKAQQYKLI